jgi:hypothetical protein
MAPTPSFCSSCGPPFGPYSGPSSDLLVYHFGPIESRSHRIHILQLPIVPCRDFGPLGVKNRYFPVVLDYI